MKKIISSKSAKIKAKRRLQRGVYFLDYVKGAIPNYMRVPLFN